MGTSAYKYSPISEIQIRDFRNLGNVTLDFKDSPIISLRGDNESGKTSVVKAIGVCSMNLYDRSQKDYIRDGTNGFAVGITLADGTQVVRSKTATMNKFIIKPPNATTREQLHEHRPEKGEAPQEVQDIMGLLREKETGEILNIRTYEDQLLFVVTPASTNYKVMYDALKIEHLTKALALGSSEHNALKREINTLDSNVSALRNAVSTIPIIDIDSLVEIKNNIKKYLHVIELLDKIERLTNENKYLLESDKIFEQVTKANLHEIDPRTYELFGRALFLLQEQHMLESQQQVYRSSEHLQHISTDTIEKLLAASEKLATIQHEKHKLSAYSQLPESISEQTIISIDRISHLSSETHDLQNQFDILQQATSSLSEIPSNTEHMLTTFNKILSLKEQLAQDTKYLTDSHTYIDNAIKYLKQQGVATAVCPRCGEDVIIELDKFGDSVSGPDHGVSEPEHGPATTQQGQ